MLPLKPQVQRGGLGTLLNAELAWKVTPGLSFDAAERLRDMPGFRVPRDGRSLRCTWSGYRLAWDMLIQLGYRPENLQAVAPPTHAPRPWGPEAAELLTSEILASPDVYDWLHTGVGGPWALAPFQREAIWRALELGGGGLVQPPGAGKTVQAVVAAMLADPARGPALFVTKTVVADQFARAVELFARTETLVLDSPSKLPVRQGKRLTVREVLDSYLAERTAAGQRAVVVLGWSTLRVVVAEVETYPWTTIVYDEVQYAKGVDRFLWGKTRDGKPDRENKDTVSCAAFRMAERVPWRLWMTGTPVHDTRVDLWSPLTLGEPEGWGITWTKYIKRYCGAAPGEHGGWDASGLTNTEELVARRKLVVHDVPREITHAQLPAVRFTSRVVPPSRQDKPAAGFKVQQKQLAKRAMSGDAAARQALEELDLQEAATRKRSAALEEIRAAVAEGEDKDDPSLGKVIVFTGRHADCVELAEKVRAVLPHIDVLCGVTVGEDGALSLPLVKARREIISQYAAATKPTVLVATGHAWGTGLDDMQDTDLLLIVQLPWSPGDLEQWMGRIHRHGMRRPCRITVLTAQGTADDRISARLAVKVPDAVDVGGQRGLDGAYEVVLGIDDRKAVLASIVESMRGVDDDD